MKQIGPWVIVPMKNEFVITNSDTGQAWLIPAYRFPSGTMDEFRAQLDGWRFGFLYASASPTDAEVVGDPDAE